ncbi:MAG TPA: hypothetical protein VFO28_02555, partial [Burkholderiaceae bacterium]|nr:hypothetical protein [Burkholderiaceae bacterium]
MTIGRPLVLSLGADLYVLRACELHDIDPVVLCAYDAFDTGRVTVPRRGKLVLVNDVTSVEDCLGALH